MLLLSLFIHMLFASLSESTFFLLILTLCGGRSPWWLLHIHLKHNNVTWIMWYLIFDGYTNSVTVVFFLTLTVYADLKKKKKQRGIRLDQEKGQFKTDKPLILSFTSSLSSSKYLTWKWLIPKEALICKKCSEIRINLIFSQKRPNFSLTTREPSKVPTAGANPEQEPSTRLPCTFPRTTPPDRTGPPVLCVFWCRRA